MIWNLERRKCSKCEKEWSITEFYLRRNGTRETWCKQCMRAKSRRYDRKHRDRHTSDFRGQSNPNIDLGLAILLAITKGQVCLSDKFIAAFCQCTGEAIRYATVSGIKKIKIRHKDVLQELKDYL